MESNTAASSELSTSTERQIVPRKVSFAFDNLQEKGNVVATIKNPQISINDDDDDVVDMSSALELVQREDPVTFQFIKDKSIEAYTDKTTGKVGIAVNASDENVSDETKQCPFIYVIVPIHRNTGNFVKIGSAVFQHGDKRMFISRVKTFIPASFIAFL